MQYPLYSHSCTGAIDIGGWLTLCLYRHFYKEDRHSTACGCFLVTKTNYIMLQRVFLEHDTPTPVSLHNSVCIKYKTEEVWRCRGYEIHY